MISSSSKNLHDLLIWMPQVLQVDIPSGSCLHIYLRNAAPASRSWRAVAQAPSEQISKIFPDTVVYYDSLEHMPASSCQESPHSSPGVSCANPPWALTKRACHKVNTSPPLPFLSSRLIFYLPLSCNTGYSGVWLLTAALNPKLSTRQHVGCRLHSLILANEVRAFVT